MGGWLWVVGGRWWVVGCGWWVVGGWWWAVVGGVGWWVVADLHNVANHANWVTCKNFQVLGEAFN